MNLDILSALHQIYPRRPDTHKGDYGKILVLAGSRGMTGSAYLCAKSALRAGGGLVYLGVPHHLTPVMEAKLTEVIIIPLAQTKQTTLSVRALARIKSFVDKIDYLVIGPGLSGNKSTQKLIQTIVTEIDKPILLDADGINAFQDKSFLLQDRKNNSLILTPHPGEFSRLLKLSVSEIKNRREQLVKEFASKFNLTLVLKGHNTIVASCDGRTYINTTGNPGMATAGSGDVLSGVIAGLRAQGLNDFQSAILGVYLHGLAGDIASQKMNQLSLTAEDILDQLPSAITTLIKMGTGTIF